MKFRDWFGRKAPSTAFEEKFSEEERDQIVGHLERKLQIRLRRIESFRKLLMDRQGKYYVVVGGELWHGISENLMNTIERKKSETFLVFAYRDPQNQNSFSLFMGSIEPIVNHRNAGGGVFVNSQGQFSFTFSVRGSSATISGLPDFELDLIERCTIMAQPRHQPSASTGSSSTVNLPSLSAPRPPAASVSRKVPDAVLRVLEEKFNSRLRPESHFPEVFINFAGRMFVIVDYSREIPISSELMQRIIRRTGEGRLPTYLVMIKRLLKEPSMREVFLATFPEPLRVDGGSGKNKPEEFILQVDENFSGNRLIVKNLDRLYLDLIGRVVVAPGSDSYNAASSRPIDSNFPDEWERDLDEEIESEDSLEEDSGLQQVVTHSDLQSSSDEDPGPRSAAPDRFFQPSSEFEGDSDGALENADISESEAASVHMGEEDPPEPRNPRPILLNEVIGSLLEFYRSRFQVEESHSEFTLIVNAGERRFDVTVTSLEMRDGIRVSVRLPHEEGSEENILRLFHDSDMMGIPYLTIEQGRRGYGLRTIVPRKLVSPAYMTGVVDQMIREGHRMLEVMLTREG